MRFFRRNWWKLLITLFVTLYLIQFWPPVSTECIGKTGLSNPLLLSMVSWFTCSFPMFLFMVGWEGAIFIEPHTLWFSNLFWGVEGFLFRYYIAFAACYLLVYVALFLLAPYITRNIKKRSLR